MTGPQGKGETGLRGVQGCTGQLGSQGVTGVRGLLGFTGLVGVTGIAGYAGEKVCFTLTGMVNPSSLHSAYVNTSDSFASMRDANPYDFENMLPSSYEYSTLEYENEYLSYDSKLNIFTSNIESGGIFIKYRFDITELNVLPEHVEVINPGSWIKPHVDSSLDLNFELDIYDWNLAIWTYLGKSSFNPDSIENIRKVLDYYEYPLTRYVHSGTNFIDIRIKPSRALISGETLTLEVDHVKNCVDTRAIGPLPGDHTYEGSFLSSDWVNNRIEVVSGGATHIGQIGPHNLAPSHIYIVQVYQKSGNTERKVSLSVEISRATGNVYLVKSALAPNFEGSVMLSQPQD